MSEEIYQIYAIRYGEVSTRLRGDNFLESVDDHDSLMPLDYFVWLLRSEQRTILVDTGFNRVEAIKRDRKIDIEPVEALTKLGTNGTDIDTIIVTHLHYDHAGTIDAFPNATIHLQQSEMNFATGAWMLDDHIRYAYSADHVCELIHRLFAKRVVFHDGDGDVAPGVSVHRVAGHTMGMQAVRVRTQRGWVLIASDASHFYEHWVKRVPFSICWSQSDLMASYERFEQLADSIDHVIPGHDPLVRSLYAPAPDVDLQNVMRLDLAPLRSLRDVFDV